MSIHKTTFLILGGGIAGLSAAIALQQKGIESLVAEAAPEFKPVGAGLVLAANAMKAYKLLGIDSEIFNAGNKLNQFDILDHQGKIISSTSIDTVGDGTPNVAIHRGSLHGVLLDQLNPGQILNGYRTREIKKMDFGYKIIFDNDQEIIADYVIAAEGIHSVTRNQFFPGSKVRYAGYTCWRGIAENVLELPLLRATETWGPAGRFGIVPVGDGKVYWFAVINGPADSSRFKAFDKKDLLEVFEAYHDPISSVIQFTDEKSIIHNDIYDLKPIKKFAHENVILIGDAAHATTPNMGQGACQAIEDAIILAECIKANSVISEAFQQFERQRIKRTHMIVNRSWTMGKIGQWENPIMVSLRNFLLRTTPASIAKKQLEAVYDFKLN
ncbi:MAG: FAD-dependent monooxygenase [Bacteroidota bacterium]